MPGVFVSEMLWHSLFLGEPLDGCVGATKLGCCMDVRLVERRASLSGSHNGLSRSSCSSSINASVGARKDKAHFAKINRCSNVTSAAIQEAESSKTTPAVAGRRKQRGGSQGDFRKQQRKMGEDLRFSPGAGRLDIPVLSPGAGALVRTLKRSGGGNSVAELLLSWHGAPPDLFAALGELRRQQDWDRVIQVSRWLLESGRFAPEVGTWNGLIDAYGKSGRPDLAEETLRSMLVADGSSRCIPTTATWNVTMNAWAKSPTPLRTETLFSEMQERGYVPSVVSYNTVLDALGRAGSLQKSERVFASMKAAQCSPSSTTFTLMINNYGRAGEAQKAEEVLYRMRSELRVPDMRAFTALIKAYARAGAPRSAEEWFLEMQESGWEPDVHAYNALLESYSRGGYPAGAAEVFQTMQDAQCRPDAASYNILLTAYSRQGLCQDAERTVDEMRTAGFRPSLASFTLLIGAYGRAGRIADAEAVVAAIEKGLDPRPRAAVESLSVRGERGGGPLPLRPDVRLYNALLEAYGAAGMIGPMEGLLGRMVGGAVLPSGGEEEEEEVDGERKQGGEAIVADVVSYNTVLVAYGQAGLVEKAEDVFERLRGGAVVKPDAATWTTMMGVYANRKLLRKVTQLLVKMVKEGYEPDSATRKVLLSACRSKAQMEESEAMLKNLLA